VSRQRESKGSFEPLRAQLFVAPLVVLVAALPATARAAEVSGAITLTSQYIYRGQALSDGNPAVQAGIDIDFDSGWFAGAWGSSIEVNTPGGRLDTEFDYYLGYHFAVTPELETSLSLLRYSYPGQSDYFDYDYTELLLSATLHDRYSIEFGYSDSVYGFDAIGRHLELRSEWPLRNAWILSAGIGYNDIEDMGTSNYLYWDLGASARWSRFIFDLRWYDNETPRGIFSGRSAESQLVVSVSVGF